VCPISYAEKENKTFCLLLRGFAPNESLAAVHHLFAKAKTTKKYVQKTRLLSYRQVNFLLNRTAFEIKAKTE